MATSLAEHATLDWQSLTTVVTARDTDIDPGITDMSTVEDGVAMLDMVAGTHTGGCNSFTHQSLLSKDTDPFRLDSQFEFSCTYSHQYHCESLMNLAPTGQPFESSYVGFCRIDQGQMGEIRSLLGGLGPTQQLGVIPEIPVNCCNRASEYDRTPAVGGVRIEYVTRVTEYADGHMTVGSMFARGYARKGGEPTPDATCFDIDRIEIVTL